ncbi:hypothetical protein, partial [Leptospira borgpetersenii]|uniref:hypothetical protein n=2 Tax=Leptospira borgpetersenii TaxID=174 RepID=UPI001F411BC9
MFWNFSGFSKGISKNLQDDLTKHFLYLADSPGFESVVHKIFKHAKAAKINKNTLVVEFKSGKTLTASSPGNPNSYKKFPKSFLKSRSQNYLSKKLKAMIEL